MENIMINENNKKNIETFDELIREFWEKHPDGIIKFG